MINSAASLLLLSAMTLTIVLQDASSASADFSYYYGDALQTQFGAGPLQWATAFRESCGGSHQTPIDIVTFKTVSAPSVITGLITGQKVAHDFTFSTQYESVPSSMTLTNTGYTVDLTTSDTGLTFSGAGFPDTYYKLAGVHFHWGGGPYRGSEHTINGQTFPLEMHMVHVKKQYTDVAAALASKDPSALAVLGVLFEETANDNLALTPITNALTNVKDYSDPTKRTYSLQANERFAFRQLLPAKTRKFYRYSGSLTTPTCAEVVAWTVFKQRLPISTAQLAKFRDVMDKNDFPMVDNFRPTQPLNGRLVQKFGYQILGRSEDNNEIDEDVD